MTGKEALRKLILDDFTPICDLVYRKGLTIQIAEPKYFGESPQDCYNIIEKELDMLEQYKDIEEELGIDLITLFKALKNGIFFLIDHKYLFEDSNNNIIKDFIKLDSFDLLEKSFQVDSGYILSLYDYGKTWSLTREELENEQCNNSR